MKNAAHVLRDILKGMGMEGALRFGRISANWDALFKGALSLHTAPESLSGKTLTVRVDSPAWLHQVNFSKKQMVEKLALFDIEAIRFRLARVHKTPTGSTPKPRLAPAHPSAEDIEAIERMIAPIGDDELRESIRKAALKSGFTEGERPRRTQ